ncbi:adenylate cyclase (protein phosphatase 2C) [Colletotrichum plurivorum]|uniref:Adenylate cyclase n=1 Tax=Colletotrichum plurivorum TaxID=2175906 RepID=A0A8H6KGS8_9PEZI|nr:adenylate cyclase (protein phosphatase 2C) [Colletotrichum plurivorum]
MTRNEAGSRFSSLTSASSSTDSTRSSATVRPLTQSSSASSSSTVAAARKAPMRLKTDENGSLAGRSFISDLSPARTSPTLTSASASASAPRGALSPASTTSNVSSFRDHRLSDFANYRRDLAVLETSGGRIPSIQQQPPTANPSSTSQVAPWMSPSNGGATASTTPHSQLNTTFYNDSSDNLSVASQLSPGFRPPTNRIAHQSSGSQDSPDAAYFGDERRPSLASITTLSSQGSKTSIRRGGLQKLQGFFGEEFPGRDGSESSLHSNSGRDRSRSYSHSRPTRDRNYSNATDHARDREASPSSSRPRTPVPAPEVVPFLYQEADDIARYGEAPVRDILSGPDRERYMSNENPNNPQNPPKTSSSGRSGHSIVHLPGHHHRHNRSIDDGRALRPTVSREDSQASLQVQNPRDRGGSTATVMYGATNRSRAQSPTPSGGYFGSRHNPSVDGSTSPGGQQQHHSKRNILHRLRRNKDKDDGTSRLRELPGSTRSLATKPSRTDFIRPELSPSTFPLNYAGTEPGPDQDPRLAAYNNQQQRNQTFNNRFPFSKSKGRQQRPADMQDEQIGPTDRQAGGAGNLFHLDTDLTDMDGILTKPPPLTPMDHTFIANIVDPDKVEPPPVPPKPEAFPGGPGGPGGPNGSWNAPDSWAVRRNTEDTTYQAPDLDDIGSPPRPEEKMTPYCIRIFRSDGTFATLSMALDASVADVISSLIKKTYATDALENYHIILKKHDLVRVLSAPERPLLMQKRLLQQIGYEERDRIEDVGREDNSYLCRFMFLSSRESDFHSVTNDLGLGRIQKFNHVDLSGRNLITIPISLYSKGSEIISLNLSRNLSLDLPRDFIQSCQNLRDIRFNNNEARRLPPSLGKAAKLTYLDVSNNRLEQLEHAELHGLHGILKLNLANNRLKSIPQYFGAYGALRNLNISSNFLDKFPLFLCDIATLVDLDLSFNSISSLPDEIGKLRSLEKFVITNNRLSNSLPDSFAQLISLRELDIKYNTMTNISIVSELPKLEILSADHNHISQFVGTFERIRSLKLNSNPITQFHIKEPVLTLKMLNLSYCQLASIDESFNNMLNLERLVLDKNYFVSLPQHIGNLSRLEHFSIANNNLAELPTSIGCLTELRVLDVRRNNIRKLPMELWWANKLETLNASSNILENFPKPASRQPRPANEDAQTPGVVNKPNPLNSIPQFPLEESPDSRRPSQNSSSTLLSVGPSPVPGGADRKSSVVSVYGKGGRKTSVVSRSTSQGTVQTMTPPSTRKDSSLSSRLYTTFAGSLRNLYLAENKLDDEVFDQITMLNELRVLNLSWNYINDMPQRSIKSWPQMVELYLSGNELTTLPADDLEDASLLQVLHINGNKFTNLPADISRAKKLAVLDCGSNSLKYNISNVPYDWNWNLNPNLRYLNLSGNKRLEIKQTVVGPTAANREQLADFSRLLNLRVLGLMDVTLTQPTIPDQSEDRRVRTSGSLAGHLPYGMADTLGRNEHLSTIDLVVPRFNSSETETLLGLFDGQALSSGGSKIAKYLHENFGHIFSIELKGLKTRLNETPIDALRRAFLSLNKDLVTIAIQHTEERSQKTHRGSAQPVVLSKEDLNSGGIATVAYLQNTDLYIANVGDAQAILIQTDGSHKFLTKKHDPAEPSERQRIREAGGWVSRNGRLNDLLEVSRAFGYVDLMPAVQAAPHCWHTAIKEQDDILLIATREFWEYLDSALVVDFARQERGDLMRAAQKLRDLAIAYGATNKMMVMMMSVADLKRRVERSRLHRGQSMSLYPSGLPDDLQQATRRGKRNKGDVLDSTLQRLEAEIPAPTGNVSIAFTDIKNSTTLWEMYPTAMRSAIKLHNEVMRRQLRRIGGYEVKTEGDAFMVSFPTATSALLWCFAVQISLLDVKWPNEVLNSVSCQDVFDKDNNLIFKGLSVRMGIHYGDAVSEMDPVTRRMDYFGPMVNKASRISSVADGGQITVSSDFISEIQRCLETYQDNERNGSTASEDTFDEDGGFAASIRKDLRSLTSQGFEVKEMGEKKLKGLENPEMVYSLYPHALVGRIDAHQQHEAHPNVDKPAILQAGSELAFDTEDIWALWRVSLRLEMLCSSLENVSGRGLQPPETELLERMKHRGGEVTERFLLNFMEHQVSRIETCVTSISLRHIVIGNAPIEQLEDLRAPMNDILDQVAKQMAELARYKAMYGELSDEDHGSDTEQE